jgi:hypothetical protein
MNMHRVAWKTWQGRETPEPSPEDCVRACIENATEAARRESDLRELYQRLPPGDQRLMGDDKAQSVRTQITAAESDQRHWRGLAAWWRQQCPQRDTRLPGEDDE